MKKRINTKQLSNGSGKRRKPLYLSGNSSFDPASKRVLREEIYSSDDDDDKYEGDSGSADDEKDARENTETADEKRLRVAKAYLDKIRALTKGQEDEDEDEGEETEAQRKGKRDSLVAEILQQEQLEDSGQVQRLLACRFLKPSQVEDCRVVKRHKQSVTTVALTEDDMRGFSASKDGTIIHWDVETGASERYEWPSQETSTSSLNADSKKQKNKATKKQGSKHVLALAISSDGRYLATGGLDRYIHLWDTRTREHIQGFPGHRGPVSCLTFRQGTQQLISGSFDRTIKLWSAEDRSYMDTLYGHQNEVLTVDCLRKERVLSAGRDRTLRLWKIPEETQLVFRGHAASLECCCFINNEEFLSGSDDGSIELWSLMRKKPIFIAKNAHGSSVLESHSMDLSTGEAPDDERITPPLSNGSDVGNVQLAPHMGVKSPVESWVGAVAVCKGSDLVASGAGNGIVRLWAIENSNKSLQALHDIPLNGFINSLAFARSGRFLIAGVGQEPRLGRWGRIQAARNGVALYPIALA